MEFKNKKMMRVKASKVVKKVMVKERKNQPINIKPLKKYYNKKKRSKNPK